MFGCLEVRMFNMINPIFFLFVTPGYPYVKAVEPSGCFLFQWQWLTKQKGFWLQLPFLLSYYCTVWLPAVIDVLGKSKVFFTKIHVWEYPGTAYREWLALMCVKSPAGVKMVIVTPCFKRVNFGNHFLLCFITRNTCFFWLKDVTAIFMIWAVFLMSIHEQFRWLFSIEKWRAKGSVFKLRVEHQAVYNL